MRIRRYIDPASVRLTDAGLKNLSGFLGQLKSDAGIDTHTLIGSGVSAAGFDATGKLTLEFLVRGKKYWITLRHGGWQLCDEKRN